ncbi:MAG: hypothetical protein EBR83_02830 [Verrucomicrobia bacterium]|nr:hypothetical protein [Verrucomicrobiota bacterium]
MNLNHITIKSALLPKSKITIGGSPTTAINEIIASLTAIAPAGIEVTREIQTSKASQWDPATKMYIDTGLLSRVTELVIIKANLAAHSAYAAWTAARVDAFAKGGSEKDSSLSGSLTNSDHSYAAFGAAKQILSFTINYQPSNEAQRGEGYEARIHAEMAPLAALAEARALWTHAQVNVSNTKFRRAGWGHSFAPTNCATIVKNALNDLDNLIDLLTSRAEWATKRAAELSPDLLAAEAARNEAQRILNGRYAAACAKANEGDKYAYYPTLKLDGSEVRIRDTRLSVEDIEAIAEIVATAKARNAAEYAARLAEDAAKKAI